MKEYKYITLNEEPKIKELAAEWFHSKWGGTKGSLSRVYECLSEKRK